MQLPVANLTGRSAALQLDNQPTSPPCSIDSSFSFSRSLSASFSFSRSDDPSTSFGRFRGATTQLQRKWPPCRDSSKVWIFLLIFLARFARLLQEWREISFVLSSLNWSSLEATIHGELMRPKWCKHPHSVKLHGFI